MGQAGFINSYPWSCILGIGNVLPRRAQRIQAGLKKPKFPSEPGKNWNAQKEAELELSREGQEGQPCVAHPLTNGKGHLFQSAFFLILGFRTGGIAQ